MEDMEQTVNQHAVLDAQEGHVLKQMGHAVVRVGGQEINVTFVSVENMELTVKQHAVWDVQEGYVLWQLDYVHV